MKFKIIFTLFTLLLTMKAEASYFSCLSLRQENGELALIVRKDSGFGINWTAQVFQISDNRNKMLGAYRVQLTSNDPGMKVFSGQELSLIMENQDAEGHRKSSLQVPALQIDSYHWVCKEI